MGFSNPPENALKPLQKGGQQVGHVVSQAHHDGYVEGWNDACLVAVGESAAKDERIADLLQQASDSNARIERLETALDRIMASVEGCENCGLTDDAMAAHAALGAGAAQEREGEG